MSNIFDNPEMHGLGEMGGLFSKMKKAVKKVGSKINNVRKKIEKKTVPKKVRQTATKVGKKLKQSKILQVAAIAAGAVFLGPAVGALAAKMGVASTGILAKGATALGRKAITNAVKSAQRETAKTTVKKAMVKMEKDALSIDAINKKMAADPEFNNMIIALKRAGKSDADIVAEWTRSKFATDLAKAQVIKTILPVIEAELKSNGFTAAQAKQQALPIAQQMAGQAIAKAKTNYIQPVLNAAQKPGKKAPVVATKSKTSPSSKPKSEPAPASATLLPAVITALLLRG